MGSGATKQKEGSSEKLSVKEKKILLKTLNGHSRGINCMDIMNNLLLTGSDDRTARIWDLISCECKVVLEGHSGYISCCKLWKGNFALTGSIDSTIRKWNAYSGNCVMKLEGHRGVVNKMLLFGDFLFTTAYDSTIVCWNVTNGESTRVYKGHTKNVLPIAYIEGPDHDSNGMSNIDCNKDAIVTGSMDKTARLWNISSGSSLKIYKGHKGAILCLAVDHDNKMLFTGSSDNTIRNWNLLTAGPLKVFKGHEGSIITLFLHHRLLFSASVDATARCWVAEFGDTTRKYSGHDHMISDLTYHQGLVFTGSGDSFVRAFDAKSGTLKRTFKGHKSVVNCLQTFNNTILSGSLDGSINIWNIKDLVKDRGNGKSSGSISTAQSSFSHIRRASNTSAHLEPNENSNKINGSHAPYDSMVMNNEISALGHDRKPPSRLISGPTKPGNMNFRQQRKVKKGRGGRVTPGNELQNINKSNNNHNNSNNNNSSDTDYTPGNTLEDELDFAYLNRHLQDILEGDAYWAESSNQSSVVDLNQVASKPTENEKPPNRRLSKSATSKLSQHSTPSSRPDTRSLVKRSSCDLLKKRARTDAIPSHDLEIPPEPDISEFVDDDLPMTGVETSSNTSGYRTGENNTPSTSPVRVTEQLKNGTRQRSQVSFSPGHSETKNNGEWNAFGYRNSKIATTPKRGSERSSATSSAKSIMSIQERKQFEQEILDMV